PQAIALTAATSSSNRLVHFYQSSGSSLDLRIRDCGRLFLVGGFDVGEGGAWGLVQREEAV
ncbi:hypothetical protein, partial [Mesorhizobium sp. A623]